MVDNRAQFERKMAGGCYNIDVVFGKILRYLPPTKRAQQPPVRNRKKHIEKLGARQPVISHWKILLLLIFSTKNTSFWCPFYFFLKIAGTTAACFWRKMSKIKKNILGVDFWLWNSVLGNLELILSRSRCWPSLSQLWASGSRFLALGVNFGLLLAEFKVLGVKSRCLYLTQKRKVGLWDRN